MTPPLPPETARGPTLALGAGLAALVFAARAWLLQHWGSPVPFLDQWADADLYRAWLDGTFAWSDLFTAHNEHRIALTRLANLALFLASGTWDPWAQLVLNALLHASTTMLVFCVLARELSPRPRATFAAALALLFASTAGWQNALWGFQSQVYFGNVLAVAGLAGISTSPSFTPRWWLGTGALFLALFSNAGGLLAAIAALPLAWATSRRDAAPRAWLGLAIVAAIVATGLALRVAPAQHAALHARGVTQFAAVFGRCLSWPFVDLPWLGLLVQLPLPVFAWLRWQRRTPWSSAERIAAALVVLACLHAAAIAYSRGAGLPEFRPLSRYQDPLVLGAAAQFFLLLRLAAPHGQPARLLTIAWAALVAAGLLQLTATNLTLHLPFKRARDAAALDQIRAYVKTGDAAVFVAQPPLPTPPVDPDVVRRTVDHPTLRPILPRAFTGPDLGPAVVRHAGAWLAFAFIVFGVLLVRTARRTS